MKRRRKEWSHKKERENHFRKHFDSVWNNIQSVLYRCPAPDIVRTDENLCTGVGLGVCGRAFHEAKANARYDYPAVGTMAEKEKAGSVKVKENKYA